MTRTLYKLKIERNYKMTHVESSVERHKFTHLVLGLLGNLSEFTVSFLHLDGVTHVIHNLLAIAIVIILQHEIGRDGA